MSKTKPDSRGATLQAALTANALFSATSGALLLLAPAVAGRWLGVSADVLLRLIGVGLIGFTAFIGWVVHRRPIDVAAARLITAADIGWVAGSIVLLLARASWFTSSGVAIIVAVALAVGGFAIAQTLGLRPPSRGSGSSRAPRRGR